MSYSEFTKELLDILDLNLTFHEDAFRKERINDETCFVFDGTLTYQPEECFHCHYQNKRGSSVEALKEILETTSKECVGIEWSASTNSASNVNTVERLF
ncbi:hypothetical protein EfmAA55_06090 [Enterococcus faecium]|nr:hypothetical protein EfmAA55_06090 [Enterococcus faecium]